jgi:hypothetical protein
MSTRILLTGFSGSLKNYMSRPHLKGVRYA